MDIKNKMYKGNEGSSLFQKFSYGEISAEGISEAFSEHSRRSKTKLLTKIVHGIKP